MEFFIRFRKRVVKALCLFPLILVLAGCRYLTGYPDRNTADFHKDGSVTMTSVEDFSAGSYDMEALKALIMDSVNTYNKEHPEAVRLDFFHVRDGRATLVLTYAAAADAAAFNEQPLYRGPVSGLRDFPEAADTVLFPADGEMREGSQTAGTGSTAAAPAAAGKGPMTFSDLPEDALVIRLTEPLEVRTGLPVYAISEGVTLTGPDACRLDPGINENCPAYIIVLDQV